MTATSPFVTAAIIVQQGRVLDFVPCELYPFREGRRFYA